MQNNQSCGVADAAPTLGMKNYACPVPTPYPLNYKVLYCTGRYLYSAHSTLINTGIAAASVVDP
jgi:hypothetical protein